MGRFASLQGHRGVRGKVGLNLEGGGRRSYIWRVEGGGATSGGRREAELSLEGGRDKSGRWREAELHLEGGATSGGWSNIWRVELHLEGGASPPSSPSNTEQMVPRKSPSTPHYQHHEGRRCYRPRARIRASLAEA
ncbi:unnamed protein product [Arctogadus glacialis]